MKERKKLIPWLSIILIGFSFLFACNKQTDIVKTSDSNTTNLEKSEKTKLGEKLKNPFTVEVMSEALNNLTASSLLTESVSVETSRSFFNIQSLPNDNVSGYTIKQIEDGLRGKSSWNGWCEGIKDKNNNPTEENLDELFANWF